MQIGIPYYTIEPLVKSMQASRDKDTTPDAKPAKAEWKQIYEHISMPVRAEWDAFELSLRELTQLRVGDVIEMPPEIVEQTQVTLNGTPKFIGTVGLDSDRVVVKLVKKIAENPSSKKQSHGR
jgi:flagellar motor switch protein FliM